MKASWEDGHIGYLLRKVTRLIGKADSQLTAARAEVAELKAAFDSRSWLYRNFIGRRPMDGYQFEFSEPEERLSRLRQERYQLGLLLARVNVAHMSGANIITLREFEVELLDLYENS